MRNAALWLIGCALWTDVSAVDLQNAMYVSWGDHYDICSGDAELDSPGRIAREMARYKDQGVDIVFWRVSSYIMRFDGELFLANPRQKRFHEECDRIFRRFTPIEAAVEAAHREGLKICAYLTVFDEGCPPSIFFGGPFPWQSTFTAMNPEVLSLARDGTTRHWGVPEYAYPEARRNKISQIGHFFEKFAFDGVYVCTRTHSPPAPSADFFGFNPPVVAEYRKRFGQDIRTEAFDLERWRQLRGEYFLTFHRELRRAFPGKIIAAGWPRGHYLGPPFGNLYLDYETLIQERLVDMLVVGVHSGKGLHKELYQPHREIGYLTSEDDDLNIPSWDDVVWRDYGPLCREARVRLLLRSPRPAARLVELLRDQTGLEAGLMLQADTCLPDPPGVVRIKHSEALCFPAGPLTAEAFIQPRTRPERIATIMSKYGHVTAGDESRGWEIHYLRSGAIRFRVNCGAAGEIWLESKGTIEPGRWTHVACVLEGGDGRAMIYIDGKRDEVTKPCRGPIRVNPSIDLWIGRYGGYAAVPFVGAIDEVRLSTVARTFTAPPQAPYDGRDPDTLALWHFDEVTKDGTTSDASGEPTHNGTVSGMHASTLKSSMPGFGRAIDIGSLAPPQAKPANIDAPYVPDPATAVLLHLDEAGGLRCRNATGSSLLDAYRMTFAESSWLRPGKGPERVAGRFGRGLRFSADGRTALAIRPNPALAFGNGTLTVEAWINPDKDGPERQVLVNHYTTRYENYGHDDRAWEVALEEDAKGGFRAVFTLCDLLDSVLRSRAVLAPGVWTHLACAADGDSMRIFINGELDTHCVGPGWVNAETYDLETTIGAKAGGGEHFTGTLDELRISAACRTYNGTRDRAAVAPPQESE